MDTGNQRPLRSWRGRAGRGLAPALAAALVSTACTRSEVRLWPDGSKRLEGRISVLTGREVGTWRWFHPNGELRERGAYEDGRRSGVWTQWWSNGQRRSEGLRVWNPRTRTSEREGPWRFWHQNGALAGEGCYRAGLREGHWEASIDDGTFDGDGTGEVHLGRPLEGS